MGREYLRERRLGRGPVKLNNRAIVECPEGKGQREVRWRDRNDGKVSKARSCAVLSALVGT